jgi:hypothetical protein
VSQTPGAALRLLRVVSWTLLLLAVTSVASAQDEPHFGVSAGRLQLRTLSLAGGIVLQVPAKDWWSVSGFGDDVVTLVERKKAEAAIGLKRRMLHDAITDIDLNDDYVGIYLEEFRKAEPGARNLRHWLKEVDGRRFIVMRYERDGVAGPETVVMYSFPAGAAFYRLVCSASPSAFAKYAPLFGHIAWSLKAEPVAAPAPQ